MIIGNFDAARRRLFSFGCFVSAGFLSGSESVHGMLLVIRAMVSVPQPLSEPRALTFAAGVLAARRARR
jgi:hypothetical protein